MTFNQRQYFDMKLSPSLQLFVVIVVSEQAEEESEARALACPFRRIIPRTLVMERVRSAIEEQRLQRTRSIRRILSSSEVRTHSFERLRISVCIACLRH